MMKNLRYLALGLFALIFVLTSCDDDQGSGGSGLLSLQFNGITRPADGFVYGVWLKESGQYNLLGDFTISDQGNVTNALYTINRIRLDAAEGVLISLESENAIGGTPSAVRFMSGDFVNKGAILSVEDAASINVDFSTSSGSYILASPTAGAVNTSGIWFYDTTALAGTLNLPDIGDHWQYETWAVIDDTTVLSMGKFSHDQINTASANLYGSSLPGYNAPGQDFLMNNPLFPIDLVGKRVFMSVEPVPDDSEDSAFGIRLFSNEISRSTDGSPVDLDYVEIGLPRGLAVRR